MLNLAYFIPALFYHHKYIFVEKIIKRFSYWKGSYRKRKKDTKRLLFNWSISQMVTIGRGGANQNQKSGTSYSLLYGSGTHRFGHSRCLARGISRELDQKCSSQDMNQSTYGMPASQETP